MTMRIDLDKADGTCLPGEKITGTVVVSTDEPLAYERLIITFTGEGQVHWNESVIVPNPIPHPIVTIHSSKSKKSKKKSKRGSQSSSRTPSTPTIDYRCVNVFQSGRETYLNIQQNLSGKDGTGDILELPKGVSNFPFEFSLPPNIPMSLELAHGHIRYLISARVKRAWYKMDTKATRSFKVKGHLDLNSELGLNNSISRIDVARISLSSCYCSWLLGLFSPVPIETGEGEITYNLRLPRTGFIPGEPIPFSLDLTNTTTTNVPSSHISLIQKIKYSADKAKKTSRLTLDSSAGPGVTPGETKRWNPANALTVPNPCGLSRVDGCLIISISYEIRLEIIIEAICVSNMVTSVPIIIGSVGLS